MAYNFTPRHLLDLLEALFFSDTLVARADVAEAIFFALINQKLAYNWKHQLLFIKINEWAMLQLHKRSNIPTTVGVTKKLTQQYVGLFYILEKSAASPTSLMYLEIGGFTLFSQ